MLYYADPKDNASTDLPASPPHLAKGILDTDGPPMRDGTWHEDMAPPNVTYAQLKEES